MQRSNTPVSIARACLGVIMLGAVSLVPSPIYAQREIIPWMGAGVWSCAKFAQAYKMDPDEMERFFGSWAQGFMAGLNVLQLQEGRPITNVGLWDMERQKDYIRQFCDKNPLAKYAEAAVALYDAMRVEQGLPDWRQPPGDLVSRVRRAIQWLLDQWEGTARRSP